MMTELNTWPDEQGGFPERDPPPPSGSLWPGFPPHFLMPGIVQHPLQETQMLDPLRFHWPYPSSSPFLLPYPHCLLDSQLSQDPRFMDPVNSQQSVLSDPWFLNDPVLPSRMMVDFHAPVDSYLQQQILDEVDFPQSVDFYTPGDSPHQPFQDELTDFMIDIPQPMGCSRSSEGLVHPSETESAFVTLENARRPGDDGQTQDKAQENVESSSLPWPDVSASASSSQSDQAACSLNEARDEISINWPQVSSKRTDGRPKPMKPCNCTKSKCLKFYCSCFSSGGMCINCNCTNCHNNTKHHMERDEAIELCLSRDPEAFGSKVADDNSTRVKGSRNRSCNCKHTGCLKNYCECYKANIPCSSSCNCDGCRNYDRGSQRDVEEEVEENKYKCRSSVLPGSTVEAVCVRLMRQAAKAQRDLWSHEQVERMILEEFGLCLSQIPRMVLGVE